MGNCKLFIAYCLLTLPLLEAGILFVDHIKLAFAANDFAINTAFLNGCSYFHIFFSFELRVSGFGLSAQSLLLAAYLYLNMILPLDKSYGEISTPTLSPGKILM